MDININLTLTELFTYFGTISTIFFGYYTLIANRPRIFLRVVPIKKISKILNFDTNINLSFINYGSKPAFGLQLRYNGDFTNEFIEKSAPIDPAFLQERSKKSEFKAIDDMNQALINAKFNSVNREEKNKQHLKTLFSSEIDFIAGNSNTDLCLGVKNFTATGGLLNSKYFVKVTYKDLRDLNFPIYIFMEFIYSQSFMFLYFLGFDPLLHYFTNKLSLYFGYFIDMNNKKCLRCFEEDLSFTINDSEVAFTDNELESQFNKINESILKKNIFNEQIYLTWEKSLTKDEYKNFIKYRLEYGDDVNKYLELYNNRNQKFPKKIGLHKKILKLIDLFNNEGVITNEEYSKFKFLEKFVNMLDKNKL